MVMPKKDKDRPVRFIPVAEAFGGEHERRFQEEALPAIREHDRRCIRSEARVMSGRSGRWAEKSGEDDNAKV
jgi:hypothetical protein